MDKHQMNLGEGRIEVGNEKWKNTIKAGGSTARARSKMLTGWTGLDTP